MIWLRLFSGVAVLCMIYRCAGLLRREPKDRFTIQQIREHEWETSLWCRYRAAFLCLHQHSAAGNNVFRLIVSLCFPNVVSTMCWKVLDIFTKLSALVHFGARINVSSFGVKRSKFSALFGLDTLNITGLNFTKLSVVMHFWDKDECVSFLVKRSKSRSQQHDQRPSGRRRTELIAACWVLISSC